MKKITSYTPNLSVLFLTLLLLFGCASKNYTLAQKEAETEQLNQFFEKIFQENVSRYPTWQTYLGLKTNYGKLNNETEEFSEESLEITKKNLKELEKFNFDSLTHQGKLSYKLFKENSNKQIDGWKWRYHSYPLNQMFGYHSGLPSFLINMHTIKTEKEANDYISRVREIRRVFAENLVHVKKQTAKGIIPPKFVFKKVIDDSQNIIKGAPFSKSKKDSPLLEDFKKKLKDIKISSKKRKILISKLNKALISHLKPAYQELMSYLTTLEKQQVASHGAWSLPDGKAYYEHRLKVQTTTDLNAKEIHQYGLSEVERIHNEMRQIMKKVKFKGDLSSFFTYMKGDRFLYPNSKAGREAYLKKAREVIATMEKALPKMFNILPKARLTVKAVEPYREKSAGIAFYQGPSLYGNRPGIYYVNLYKMQDNPKYKLEGLAYHEGLPGHHLQNATKTELKDLPKFRRTGRYTAYGEGWGLYSEKLPKEFGFYKDPYSDFGRLTMELWRAARLVVDTGLHDKRWSREKAIKYLEDNTPNADLEITKAIERYIVMPGQATTYKIGMKKILDLRAHAKNKLGERFDIKNFHDVILKSGPLPLSILEEEVEKYITAYNE